MNEPDDQDLPSREEITALIERCYKARWAVSATDHPRFVHIQLTPIGRAALSQLRQLCEVPKSARSETFWADFAKQVLELLEPPDLSKREIWSLFALAKCYEPGADSVSALIA